MDPLKRRDHLTFQHCQNRCRIKLSLLSCRKQEEYRIAKGEEERDLYATEKKKSFESLEKVCSSFYENGHSVSRDKSWFKKWKQSFLKVWSSKIPADSACAYRRTRFGLFLWIPRILFSFSLASFFLKYLVIIFKGRLDFRPLWFYCS